MFLPRASPFWGFVVDGRPSQRTTGVLGMRSLRMDQRVDGALYGTVTASTKKSELAILCSWREDGPLDCEASMELVEHSELVFLRFSSRISLDLR